MRLKTNFKHIPSKRSNVNGKGIVGNYDRKGTGKFIVIFM